MDTHYTYFYIKLSGHSHFLNNLFGHSLETTIQNIRKSLYRRFIFYLILLSDSVSYLIYICPKFTIFLTITHSLSLSLSPAFSLSCLNIYITARWKIILVLLLPCFAVSHLYEYFVYINLMGFIIIYSVL